MDSINNDLQQDGKTSGDSSEDDSVNHKSDNGDEHDKISSVVM